MSAEAMRKFRAKNSELDKQRGRDAARLWRRRHPEKVISIRQSPAGRWAFFKSKTKSRGISLELTFEEWLDLAVGKDCHYCHASIISRGGSLDRKDSSIGYTKENSVPCCRSCNIMKNDVLTYEEMCYLMPLLLAFRERAR